MGNLLIQPVLDQMIQTHRSLIQMRSEWKKLELSASQQGNASLAETAKRMHDLTHDRVMDFGGRMDILKIQLQKA